MTALCSRLEAIVAALPGGARLIIDGNNFLYAESPRYGDHREPSFPNHASQAALVAHLTACLEARPEVRAELWFDGGRGGEAARLSHTLALTVHVSAGKGKNRADKEMIAFIKATADPAEAGRGGDSGLVLVTRDKGLIKRCKRWCRVIAD